MLKKRVQYYRGKRVERLRKDASHSDPNDQIAPAQSTPIQNGSDISTSGDKEVTPGSGTGSGTAANASKFSNHWSLSGRAGEAMLRYMARME
jgi:hypothetical protein